MTLSKEVTSEKATHQEWQNRKREAFWALDDGFMVLHDGFMGPGGWFRGS